MNIECIAPVMRKNPLSAILPPLKNSSNKYGFAAEYLGFTPSSIRHNEILLNDRPYAAAMMLKFFSISADSITNNRITSTLTLGEMGPLMGGKFIQTTIHKYTNNPEPLGWDNQIHDDVIINYEVAHEKQLYRYRNYFLLNTNALARIGTFNDKAMAGLTLMAGKFRSPFAGPSTPSGNNFQFYFYNQFLAGGVVYDATLQGGLFNRTSPYIIPAGYISRIVYQNNAGVVLSFRKIYLEYYSTYLSREFKTGTYHMWGGAKLGIIF